MGVTTTPVTPGSGVNVDGCTDGAGNFRQIMVPGGDGDYVGGVTPYGYLRVNSDATAYFYDGFNGAALDTVDRWANSGTAPTIGNGQATFTTTASASNAIWSKPVLVMQSGQYYNVNTVVTIEQTPATGAGRFWGVGLPAATPSSTALVSDGVGFEIEAATGSLLAVTYAGGTRTVVATIVASAALGSGQVPNFRDGLPHRFSLVYRQSRVYWFIDGFDVHIAQVAYPNLGAGNDMPVLVVRNNAASYTGTPVLVLSAIGVGDMSRNGTQVSDGTYPWRKARIDASGSQIQRDFLDGTNRTIFSAQAQAVAITATESLVSLTPTRNGTAGAAGNVQTVTAGKTLRIQSIALTVIGAATAAATTATVKLRYSNTATATATSPIAEEITSSLPTAVANMRSGANVTFGSDGFEIPAGYSFTVTLVGIASGTADIVIKGYEFT